MHKEEGSVQLRKRFSVSVRDAKSVMTRIGANSVRGPVKTAAVQSHHPYTGEA